MQHTSHSAVIETHWQFCWNEKKKNKRKPPPRCYEYVFAMWRCILCHNHSFTSFGLFYLLLSAATSYLHIHYLHSYHLQCVLSAFVDINSVDLSMCALFFSALLISPSPSHAHALHAIYKFETNINETPIHRKYAWKLNLKDQIKLGKWKWKANFCKS